jgi:hypothetical protein
MTEKKRHKNIPDAFGSKEKKPQLGDNRDT